MAVIVQNTNVTNAVASAISLNSGDTLMVGSGVNVDYTGGGYVAAVSSATGNVNIYDSGTIFGGLGISLGGGTNTVNIMASGSVIGWAGPAVQLTAGTLALTNAGFISGAVEFDTGGNIFTNSGTVHGDSTFNGDGNVVINSGSMSGAYTVQFINGVDGSFNTVSNSGTIYGGVYSIVINVGGGQIDNSGTLLGSVLLGSGAMAVDNDGLIRGGVYGSQASTTVTNTGTIDGPLYFHDADDVYAGARGTVTGQVSGAGGNDKLTGSEGDENFDGGAGNDRLKGNAGDDTLTGGLGSDNLTGGNGEDTFVYNDRAESTGKNYDTVVKFDTGEDQFDLNVGVGAIDTAVGSGTLNGNADFNTNLAAAVGAAQLGAHHAVLFTATAGTLAGHTFLIVDANGTAGYQAGKDYVIELKHPVDLASLSIDNFS